MNITVSFSDYDIDVLKHALINRNIEREFEKLSALTIASFCKEIVLNSKEYKDNVAVTESKKEDLNKPYFSVSSFIAGSLDAFPGSRIKLKDAFSVYRYLSKSYNLRSVTFKSFVKSIKENEFEIKRSTRGNHYILDTTFYNLDEKEINEMIEETKSWI